MKKRRLLYLFYCTFFSILIHGNAWAQQNVRGTLRTPAGEPLAGATITVKGTNTSAVSNSNGEFVINAPAGSTLVISYIGYTTQEAVANDSSPLNIQLQASNQELQQVVVIGYQAVMKRDLTGATGV